MPYTIDILPDLSVIHVKYTGEIDKELILSAIPRIIEVASQITGPHLFHIVDISQGDVDFASVMGIFKELAQITQPSPPSGTIYHRLFLGTSEMAKLSAQMMNLPQFGGLKVPLFKTFDDAMNYVRQELNILETSE